MKLREFLSVFFILVLSTQVLPLEEVNFLMKKNVYFDMVEEINENHGSSQSNQLNEYEYKLIVFFNYEGFIEGTNMALSQSLFNEYQMMSIMDPFIEESEIPPNILS